MQLDVLPLPIEDKPVLANLLELYMHDFSEFAPWDLNEHGIYGYRYLDHYWTESGRHPFIVRVDGRLAGFALVRILVLDERSETQMSEFFILRKYRRQGIGEAVARQLFDQFPGQWSVTQMDCNIAAQRFWRAIIDRYTGGTFDERHDANRGRVVQVFTVPPAHPSETRATGLCD
jgi:predicted acetyltransferase